MLLKVVIFYSKYFSQDKDFRLLRKIDRASIWICYKFIDMQITRWQAKEAYDQTDYWPFTFSIYTVS